MPAALPFLVVGQGLAGTALAWQFWERGVPFLIVDPEESETSSKLAAGLVTPITGLRLTLSWHIAEVLPVALDFYHRVESTLGGQFYHELPIVRLLREPREVAFWEKRKHTAEIQDWVDHEVPAPLVNREIFKDEYGGIQQRHSGWLDTAAYLEASRQFFDQHGCWRHGQVLEENLVVTPESVAWEGSKYAGVILCRGWEQQNQSRFFPWLKFGSARGVIVDLEADIEETRIINRGCWISPRGEGHWRAGSTYDFDLNRPLVESVAELEGKLQALLKVPFQTSNARSGVRPVLQGRQLALGTHPVHRRIAVFNGLGSKGVLRAPHFSSILAAHLLDGVDLPDEVDVQGNH